VKERKSKILHCVSCLPKDFSTNPFDGIRLKKILLETFTSFRFLLIKMLRSVRRCSTGHILHHRNHFDAAHLAKNDANYAQLSPLTAFNRTTKLFPHKPAYVYNNQETTYS